MRYCTGHASLARGDRATSGLKQHTTRLPTARVAVGSARNIKDPNRGRCREARVRYNEPPMDKYKEYPLEDIKGDSPFWSGKIQKKLRHRRGAEDILIHKANLAIRGTCSGGPPPDDCLSLQVLDHVTRKSARMTTTPRSRTVLVGWAVSSVAVAVGLGTPPCKASCVPLASPPLAPQR
ncbi:hypothetical protein GW17_00049789 [Ensete ventricosum]|nr:hypothetical protein GW17_00049789 [Ensete ventricosum]